MTEPSKWAQELASHVFLCTLDRDTRRNIAFALDFARRKGLEEAARWFAPNFPGQARDMLRDLIDREPAP